MPRLHTVAKAQKHQGHCDNCGAELPAGQPYKWVKLKLQRGGLKKKRCANCPAWRPSELTMSKMSGVYAAQEATTDALMDVSTFDDLVEIRDNAAAEIRAVGEEYQEAYDNAPGLQAESEEKAQALEDWASDIENADCDQDGEDEEGSEDYESELDGKRDELQALIDECPI
jgi:hypothetical protein